MIYAGIDAAVDINDNILIYAWRVDLVIYGI